MDVSIEKTETGHKIVCKLVMKFADEEDSSEFTLTASHVLNQGDLMSLITDDSQSRQVAVHLVGRLLTTWKLGLIKAMSDAVAEAAQMALAAHVGGRSGAGGQ